MNKNLSLSKEAMAAMDLTPVLSSTSGLDLTLALTEDIWTDLLSDLNIYRQNNALFESTDYLQQILLNNVQKKRYKQPTKYTGISFSGEKREEWLLDGLTHREDGPAETLWSVSGYKAKEKWYQHGQLHREDGPATINWNKDGTKGFEGWYQNDQKHRTDGPAQTGWMADGTIWLQEWYQHDQRHREDGPAVTEWYLDQGRYYGRKKSETWYLNGVVHRDGDKPAYTKWWGNGRKWQEIYYVDGSKDRDPKLGPAYFSWHEDGRSWEVLWFVKDDDQLPEEYYDAGYMMNLKKSLRQK